MHKTSNPSSNEERYWIISAHLKVYLSKGSFVFWTEKKLKMQTTKKMMFTLCLLSCGRETSKLVAPTGSPLSPLLFWYIMPPAPKRSLLALCSFKPWRLQQGSLTPTKFQIFQFGLAPKKNKNGQWFEDLENHPKTTLLCSGLLIPDWCVLLTLSVNADFDVFNGTFSRPSWVVSSSRSSSDQKHLGKRS